MSTPINKETYNRLNDLIMALPATFDETSFPKIHSGLNPSFMQMRQELISLNTMTLQARQIKLRSLLMMDYLQEDAELRSVQLASLNTQP